MCDLEAAHDLVGESVFFFFFFWIVSLHIRSFIVSLPYLTSSKNIQFAHKHHKMPLWEGKKLDQLSVL